MKVQQINYQQLSVVDGRATDHNQQLLIPPKAKEEHQSTQFAVFMPVAR
jgi:hypothetical protein